MKPPQGRARRVIRNSLSLSVAEIFSRLFTWVTITYLARHWTLDYYGQYAVVVNWVTIFSAFSAMGMSALTVLNVAHQKSLSNYYLRATTGLRLIFSAMFILALVFIGSILGYESLVRLALVVLGIRLLFDAVAASYISLLQAHELMTYQGIVSLISALLRTVCILAVVYFGGQMVEVCWVWVAISLLSFLALWSIGRRQGWRIDLALFRWKEAWDILKRSVPFAAFGVFQIFYYRVDGIILKSFAGNEAVALYDIAVKLLFVVFMIADHFSISTLPTFSAIQDRSKDLGRVVLRALKVLILLGVPLTVGGFFLSDPLMILIGGAKYAAAGPAFAILSGSIFFHFSMKPSINLLAIKAPVKLTYLFLGLFLLNVAVNLYAIPHWGLMGAAVVSVLCEAAALVVGMWLTSRHFQRPSRVFYRGIFAAVMASAVMGAGIHFDPRLYWVAMGPLVYGTGLFLLGGIDRDDMASLRSIFKRVG